MGVWRQRAKTSAHANAIRATLASALRHDTVAKHSRKTAAWLKGNEALYELRKLEQHIVVLESAQQLPHLYSYDMYSYGPCSYGLYPYGISSGGPYSYGRAQQLPHVALQQELGQDLP